MKLFLYSFRSFDETEFFDQLREEFDYSYGGCSDYPTLNNAHLAQGYDAVSITPGQFDAPLLERFSALGVRYILTRSIGYDHIDLEAARALDMRVSCVTYPPETVANYAVTLLLMSLRSLRQIMDRANIQDYSLKGKIGRDIDECTVGVIGTGRIGKTVIQRLHAFGCRLLAYDIHPDHALSGLCEFVPLDTLFRESDAITLHAPATEENVHMLNHRTFSLMKEGAVVVNTARGTLIDTAALISALEQGRLCGAALDVLEDENGLYYHNRVGDCIPNPQMAQLRAFPNVILTPHTAFYTRKVVRSMAFHTVQCLFDMAENRSNPLIIV